MELSIAAQGLSGMTWPAWKQLVEATERLGFAGLYYTDHFVLPEAQTADQLELIVALTYLAAQTQRLHFGPLVAPFSFRDPVMLARQAAVLGELSGGRMRLGVGAGWMAYEHEMFGYELGDLKTRMARFTEGLEIITQLLNSNEPVQYHGTFYHLREATLYPRPAHPLPILVGGKGPRRSLQLVARYADIWNASRLSPAEFSERSALLDAALATIGRDAGAVKRTVMIPVLCGRTPAEIEQRVQGVRQLFAAFAAMPLDALLDAMREMFGALIVGSPEAVVAGLRAYADAGVSEMIIQWFGTDIEGLELLAEDVAPQVAGV